VYKVGKIGSRGLPTKKQTFAFVKQPSEELLSCYPMPTNWIKVDNYYSFLSPYQLGVGLFSWHLIWEKCDDGSVILSQQESKKKSKMLQKKRKIGEISKSEQIGEKKKGSGPGARRIGWIEKNMRMKKRARHKKK